MARDSPLLKNTLVGTYPLKEKNYREIALGWRKGSARDEEFKALAYFIQEQQEQKLA